MLVCISERESTVKLEVVEKKNRAGHYFYNGSWGIERRVVPDRRTGVERYGADGFSQDTTVLASALVWSVVCSMAAGWVAGRIGKDPLRSGKILGVVLLAVGVMVQVSAWQQMPLWYHIPFLGLLFPVAKMGAARGGRSRSARMA